jgi:hypothetical protein
MVRKREATQSTGDVFDQQIAANQAAQAEPTEQQAATATPEEQPSTDGRAQESLRKKYTPPADPFGFENRAGKGNRVQLLKSEGEGAWVIRFAKSPNEMDGHRKENPHPVIKMLKEEGYRWGFDGGDGKGGWGKKFQGDPYGADHIEARRVLQTAAEMIGAKIEQAAAVSA